MEHLEFGKIHVDIDGEFATLTINDPDKLNALSWSMFMGINDAFHELQSKDRHIRALLIKGEGRAFCAGLNLGDRDELQAMKASSNVMDTHVIPLMRRFKDAPFPTICAVNGPCAGIGVTIALMCDVAIAGRSAYFYLPFVKGLGSVGDAGISWILPRIIGWARARHMLMFGNKVGAQDALDWGMLYDIAEDDELQAKTEAVARDLATRATVALATTRTFVWEGLENSYERQLQVEQVLNVGITHQTEDYKNAKIARVEGRKPDFRGR